MRDYDFFVIGAGSGGVRAARMAATAGARVGIAENSRLGGTCVNVGCVPKKLMVYASHVSEEIEDAAGYGWQVRRGSFDWSTLIANKDREIARLNDIYRSLLVNAGVDLFEERAELDGPHGVLATQKVPSPCHTPPPAHPAAVVSKHCSNATHAPDTPPSLCATALGWLNNGNDASTRSVTATTLNVDCVLVMAGLRSVAAIVNGEGPSA